MINTKRNNRLETYRGDTGILNVNVSGYNFVEGDYAILSVKKDFELRISIGGHFNAISKIPQTSNISSIVKW